jgi:hypothetical protein
VTDAGRRPPDALDVRPRRVVWVAGTLAAVLVAVFVTVAVLLRKGDTGVNFQPADQVAMAMVGVLLAAGALLFARPRVRADAEGVHVRNVIGTHRLPWSLVRRVSFPDGSSWARLDLPDDEYVPVMAIQSADGEHAVRAIRALRELHHRYTAAPRGVEGESHSESDAAKGEQ